MSEVDEQAIETARETTRRFCEAMESHDLESFLATLAPDVVLHSPFTTRTQFRGHEEMRTLMRAHFASIEDVEYYEIRLWFRPLPGLTAARASACP